MIFSNCIFHYLLPFIEDSYWKLLTCGGTLTLYIDLRTSSSIYALCHSVILTFKELIRNLSNPRTFETINLS